jgi:glyoxylase-like metal-dependent hydrolase (beta-lactamase superfamily II)
MLRHACILSFALAARTGPIDHSASLSHDAGGQRSASDVLLASIEAIGGLERLQRIRGVWIEEVGREYLISTVTRADAPPRLIAQTVATLRSAPDSALRRTTIQTMQMRAGPSVAVTVVKGDAVALVRNKVTTPGTLFDLISAREELALSPERILLTALDARDLRLDRDTVIASVRHRVISLGLDGAPVRVFIDAASGFPTRVELVRAYPTNVFWAMWGDLRFVTTWSAWALTDGVWYPRQRAVTLNGQPFREYQVTALDVEATVPADSVAFPDSVRQVFTRRAALERVVLSEKGNTVRLTPVELSPGIVLYRGGYQSAAVRQRDGVVIIEAPESAAKSRTVLADVAARWPGARVKAVVSTSPMWMHIGGLREYAARRIPVYALDVNAPVVRALFSAPHTQARDSLARARVTPVVRRVARLTTIGEGAERIELRPARGQHASSMMLVWFPATRLLYASDVIIPDGFEPVFTSAYLAELDRIVGRERLDVDRVFAEHLDAMPWSDRAK